jgi:hypothetical protein
MTGEGPRPQSRAPIPQWQVRTQKSTGTVVIFQTYNTLLEATQVARRLRGVGCQAEVVEVRG